MSQEIPVCVNLEEKIQRNRENRDQRNPRRFNRGGGRDRRDNNNQNFFRGGRRFSDKDTPWTHDLYRQEERGGQNRRRNSRARINIESLHYSVTQPELKEIAEKWGAVKFCKIDWDTQGRSKETATIEYLNEDDARRAIEHLDGLQVESVPMRASLIEASEDEGRRRNFNRRRFDRFDEGQDRRGRNRDRFDNGVRRKNIRRRRD